MIQELGVAAIPPTEFYTDENKLIVEIGCASPCPASLTRCWRQPRTG